MFRRLPETRAPPSRITVDGKADRGARPATRSPRRCWPPASTHCRTTPVTRRAARALLHDGRVLRLPGHDRRRRQPPGLPGAGARGHADRDPARQAGGRDDDRRCPTSRRLRPRRRSAPGRPGCRRGDRWPRAPACRPCCSTRTPASAARSIARITVDAGHRPRRSWATTTGRAPRWRRRPRRAARRSSTGATVWSLDPQRDRSASRSAARRA